MQEGDCQYFKRVDKRSVSERVEIASVDEATGTLTLTTPLHWTFRAASPHSAQIAKAGGAIVRWAGIEGLALQGGTNPGYDGQMAGGIDVSNAADCWIKDVQTDGTIGGMHVSLTGTFRCVVRDRTSTTRPTTASAPTATASSSAAGLPTTSSRTTSPVT